MQAGFGAEDQVSRKARRIANLRAAQLAADQLDVDVKEEIARAEEDKRRWAQGAEGERLVAAALTPLQRYGWWSMHDVHWPGRPLANIDHIAIGPGGVFVIDAKNWSGTVMVRDGELRQNGYRQTAKAEGAQQAARAVTALLAPQHRLAVAAVICLAAQDHDPVHAEPGIVVVGRHQFASMLIGVAPRLTPFDVADLGRYLQRELCGDRSPTLVTTRALGVAPGRSGGPRQAPLRSGRRDTASQLSEQTTRAPHQGRSSHAGRPRGRGSGRWALVRVMWAVGVLAALMATLQGMLQTMAP